MVSKEGFPVAYEIFSGNTFEGHTIIPVINDYKFPILLIRLD